MSDENVFGPVGDRLEPDREVLIKIAETSSLEEVRRLIALHYGGAQDSAKRKTVSNEKRSNAANEKVIPGMREAVMKCLEKNGRQTEEEILAWITKNSPEILLRDVRANQRQVHRVLVKNSAVFQSFEDGTWGLKRQPLVAVQ